MVSFIEHEREHRIEAENDRRVRLAALREVREMMQDRPMPLGAAYNVWSKFAADIDALIKREEEGR